MKLFRYHKYLMRYLLYQIQYIFRYHKLAKTVIGLGNNVRIRLEKNSSTILGRKVFFDDFSSLEVFESARVDIREGVQFNRFCVVSARDKILVGENTIFGPGCKLYDHNHKFDCLSPVCKMKFKTGPITIGQGCWLGSNVVVCKGVSIGDFCVIGANKVVRNDVPPGTIVK